MKEQQIDNIEVLNRVIKLCNDCIEVLDNNDKIESYLNVIRFCEIYKKINEGLL